MNPHIAAAIDVGTNSTKMMVARIEAGEPKILFDRSEVTRLGKGVDAGGKLGDEAVERTLEAIVRYAAEAHNAGVSVILAAGTSALRDASNGASFIEAARERAGVDIEIVDGDREAQLSYAAIRNDQRFWTSGESTTLLVFDIGGGSTELIVGGKGGVQRHRSLNIGAVRLTERFVNSDPPSNEEIAKIEGFALGALEDFGRPEGPVSVAGIGGTAVNIAAVIASRRDANIHGSTVRRDDVDAAYARFCSVPLDERRQIPGLDPARADVIVAGAAILSQLLAFVDAPEFRVSTRGLRYGLLADYASQQT